jgi:4-amino-4-deoxy-L-arabinose transferase-like glycosyltransferase
MLQTLARVSWKEIAFDGTRTPVKTFLFLLVCLVWILPGLIGHDPWKPDEAQNFAHIHRIVQSGDWFVASQGSEAPLYSLTAAAFARTLQGVLPEHDAARLATGFYMALAMLFTGLAARELFGFRFGRLSVLIFIGCLGLLLRAHEMVSDVALLAGLALAYWGLAKSRVSGFAGGAAIGTGIGIAFMSKGLIAPFIICCSAVLLPLVFREWRTLRFLQAWVVAPFAALPWIALWPLALYKHSAELLSQWLSANSFSGFISTITDTPWQSLRFFVELLPWYAWPALPLALWALWANGRKGLRYPSTQLPLIGFLVSLVAIALFAPTGDLSAMPMLIPLSILASGGVDTLRRSAASAFDWFGMMTFGILSFVLWLGFIALFTGFPARLAKRITEYQPGFTPQFHLVAFLFALALTIIWLMVVWRTRQSNRRAIVNWTAGITMFWLLAMALWLPYIDHGRSYRSVFTELKSAIPANNLCLASKDLGDSQRALLSYYGVEVTAPLYQPLPANIGDDCALLLVQASPKKPTTLAGNWKKIWEGSRPGERNERFWLYQRK